MGFFLLDLSERIVHYIPRIGTPAVRITSYNVCYTKLLRPTELPLLPAFAAAAVGIAVLAGFALPPLARLADVPPVAVFRASLARRIRRFDALYLVPALVAGALIWLQSDSLKMAGILAGAVARIGPLGRRVRSYNFV